MDMYHAHSNSPPPPVSTRPTVAATNEIIYDELCGFVYPQNWGGTAKYNLTSMTMSDNECTLLYGFPSCSFRELVHRLTKVGLLRTNPRPGTYRLPHLTW